MVERLKYAIEKARAEREGRSGQPAVASQASSQPPSGGAAEAEAIAAQAAVAEETAPTEASGRLDAGLGSASAAGGPGAPWDWSAFPELDIDDKRLARARIVSHKRSDPAYRAFDMLRTRTLRAFKDNGWSRLAITSPIKGAGKTLVSLNMAFSLARQPGAKVLLLDLDLAVPQLSEVLAPKTEADIQGYLTGEVAPQDYFQRCGENLLLGLNRAPVQAASELLQSETAAMVIADTIARAKPTIVIYDTSPVLVSDDALSVMAHADCAMMVVAAGETRAREIEESEKLIAEWTELLGVVLNKSEEKNRETYGYGY